MQFKIIGSIMILPTIALAYYITFFTRTVKHHLLPNIAVSCWITANSLWMLWEFFDVALKPVALVFFIAGLVIISLHYLLIDRITLKKQS